MDTGTRSVRERAEAICAANGIKPYRLAQLLRIMQRTLRQDTPGSQLMQWVLLRCEEEGLGYFEAKERDLGVFGVKGDRS
jgi:hypothetical protein